MTPIERAARALCQARLQDPDAVSTTTVGWRDPVKKPAWTLHVKEARVVIQAIREPSEAMLEAGAEHDSETGDSGNPRKIFPAMIDAALEEG